MFHWYTDRPMHGLPHFILLLTIMSCLHITVTHVCHVYISLLHMHVWFLYSCHMDPCSYYMYSYSMLFLYACFMIAWFPLLDTWAVDMQCVEFHSYCFPFPIIVFRAINRAHVMLSCYMYYILYLFLIYYIVKDNKENLLGYGGDLTVD